AAQARTSMSSRAPSQLQPQVLPRLAAPLLLFRTVGRPAARRPRIPARGITANATRPVGSFPRPGCAMRVPLAGVIVLLLFATGASARSDALHVVRIAHFNAPVYAPVAPGE